MTAKEAHTSLKSSRCSSTPQAFPPRADVDPFAPLGEQWVPSGQAKGGVTSGLSHLHADMYELENSSARCGRLLVRVMKHPEELESRREEIIDALNATAKPYFGDLKAMTYLAWAQRFADLAFPWVDEPMPIASCTCYSVSKPASPRRKAANSHRCSHPVPMWNPIRMRPSPSLPKLSAS